MLSGVLSAVWLADTNIYWGILHLHWNLGTLQCSVGPLERCEFPTYVHLPQCRIYASVNWVSIGSNNGVWPGRRQAIIWTSAAILSIRPQGTYFNEILFEIQMFSFKKMRLNMSSAKWRPFCPGGDQWKDPSSLLEQPWRQADCPPLGACKESVKESMITTYTDCFLVYRRSKLEVNKLFEIMTAHLNTCHYGVNNSVNIKHLLD